MSAWNTRHLHKIPEKKEKGPVEPEKEKEKDELEIFFCHLFEFHNPVPVAPVFVLAELPPRYAISFVPAVASHVHVSVSPTAASVISAASDFSVVPPVFTSPSSCIGTTQ